MNPESICLNVRRIRESLDLSITKMAAELGMSRIAYNNVEKGRTKTVSPTIYKISELSGLPPEEVLLGRLAPAEESQILKDVRDNYKAHIDSLVHEYEDKLDKLRSENKADKALLKEKDERIRTLESYVAYLQKEHGTAEK